MESILILNLAVDAMLVLYMLVSIVHLSNRDNKIEREIARLKQEIERNSILGIQHRDDTTGFSPRRPKSRP